MKHEADLHEWTVTTVASGSDEAFIRISDPPTTGACTDNLWETGGAPAVPPNPVTGHTAIWTGNFVIEWGGVQQGGVPQASPGYRYDPTTDTSTYISKAPSQVQAVGHTAIWTGSEMIIWGGGANSGQQNSGGRYDPVTDTWGLTSTVGAPVGRSEHTAVWTGSKMIVYGGRGLRYNPIPPTFLTSSFNDGGLYDPQTDSWTLFTGLEANQGGRLSHSAVWTGNRMIVWGGHCQWIQGQPQPSCPSTLLNTGFQFDPATNSSTFTSTVGSPSGRDGPAAVWTGTQLIVWSGNQGNTPPVDGGRYDPVSNTWAGVSVIDAPVVRQASLVWTGSRMVAWSGFNGSINASTGALYDPAGDAWTPMSMTDAPSARSGATAVWTGARVVFSFGGGASNMDPRSRYDPSGDTWFPTAPLPFVPVSRSSFAAAWTGTRLLIWGATSFSSGNGAVYDPALAAWTMMSTLNAPSSRVAPTSVWTGSRMIIWGGNVFNGGNAYGDGGLYDPVSDTWSPAASLNAPSPRTGHGALWTGNLMIIWGGTDNHGQQFNTGALYDPSTDTWTPTSMTGAPEPRSTFSSVWTGHSMIVWGGVGSDDTSIATGGRYDPLSDSWTPTTNVGAPSARHGGFAVWTGARMIVWSGSNRSQIAPVDGGGQYDPATDVWISTSEFNAPAAREGASAVWTGKLMIVWGGTSQGTLLRNGGRYNPAADSWMSVSTINAGQPRANYCAFWTGTGVLVWGGGSPTLYDSVMTYLATPVPDDDGDGLSPCGGDCDDTKASVYPGAPQICDGLNNDCTDPSWPALTGSEVDQDGDGLSMCLGDCDDARPSVYPGAPQLCDGINNDCGDPNWPMVPANEADADGDGVRVCQNDCNDSDGTIWSTPGEVQNAIFAGGTNPALSWSAPANPGATTWVYDLIRADVKNNFTGGGSCILTNTTSTTQTTSQNPALGHAYYFLVRAENSCPAGQGSLGTYSNGAPRTARTCP
jgi:hypothetical protein